MKEHSSKFSRSSEAEISEFLDNIESTTCIVINYVEGSNRQLHNSVLYVSEGIFL